MEDASEDPAIAETLTAVAGPRIPARSSGWPPPDAPGQREAVLLDSSQADPTAAEMLQASIRGCRDASTASAAGWRTWGCSGREMDAVAGSSASRAQDS
jgi:hypothetical protein